jgi:hypothetical protein
MLGLLFFGLPLFRDAVYDFIGIYGGLLFETPSTFLDIHVLLGFLLIIFGLTHIGLHINDTKSELIMREPVKDFKVFLHSLFYLIGFAKSEEFTGGDKYNGRQRIVYLALIFTIGLSAISGVALFFEPVNEMHTIFLATHLLSAVILILVLLFHLAITIRHHDSVALKCGFATGTLPLWHIKKNHKIWYLKILRHEKKLTKQAAKLSPKQKTTDPIAKALIKIYSLDGITLSANDAEKLAQNFKKSYKPDELKKFIEISKTL